MPVIRRRKNGFTLIELLVAITLFTGMFSLVGMTFHLLMRSEKLVTQSLVTERTISRLAIQFRDDVHQSVAGDVTPESPANPNQLALKNADGVRVRYRITKEGIARLIIENDVTVAREDFRLPNCLVRLFAGVESESSLRTLTIERPLAMVTRQAQAAIPLRPLKIEAYLNRQPLKIGQTDTVDAVHDRTRTSDATEQSK